jgi:hypothetical protein
VTGALAKLQARRQRDAKQGRRLRLARKDPSSVFLVALPRARESWPVYVDVSLEGLVSFGLYL